MLLGVCLLLGLVIASLLGANIGRLAELQIRHAWSVFAALAIQLVIFTSLQGQLPAGLIAPLHIVSYVLVGLFLAANITIAGMPLIGVGWAANTTAILANGGSMPISLRDWQTAGRAAALLTKTGTHNNNVLADHARLVWLGDVFPLPSGVPLANAFSVGDVLIVAGAVVILAVGGSASTAKRGFVAPLAYRPFVRLLAGRGLSQLGDWITISAAVTWIYSSTSSTWWVSGFMIARLSAFLIGGTIGPLTLGMSARQRFAPLLLGRGILTLAALCIGLLGSVLGAIALLVLSALLAPATNAGSGGLIPQTVPSQLLHRANALNGFILELALVAGTAVGGLVEVRLGLSVPLALDVATFLVAAIALSDIAIKAEVETSSTSSPVSQPTLRALSCIFYRDRIAAPLIASFATATFAFAIVNSSLPRFLTERHEPDGYGVGMACVGAGAMLGGLLVGSMTKHRAIRRSISLAFLGTAATLALIAKSEVATTIYLALFLTGFLDAATEVSYSTLMQQRFSDGRLSAALTLASSYISIGMLGGFIAAGLLNTYLGVGDALVAAAISSGFAATIALPIALSRPSPNVHPANNDQMPARRLLDLPASFQTRDGATVTIIREEGGLWLARGPSLPSAPGSIELLTPDYKIHARTTRTAGNQSAWLELDTANVETAA